MPRRRISIQREDRIWYLRCQGYDYDSIARIVDVHPVSITSVIRRVRRRPPLEQDPIRRGRGHSFLSDQQVHQIRMRRARGEKLLSLAREYSLTESSICRLAQYRTYQQPEVCGYPWSFDNRLVS